MPSRTRLLLRPRSLKQRDEKMGVGTLRQHHKREQSEHQAIQEPVVEEEIEVVIEPEPTEPEPMPDEELVALAEAVVAEAEEEEN